MARSCNLLRLLTLACAASPGLAFGLEAYPLATDINAGAPNFDGNVNAFSEGLPYSLDDTAVFEGNDIAVITMDGPSANNGAGFAIYISNGENGIDSSEGGANTDIVNTAPVNPAILTANGGQRLQNGNALRLSVWMRSDPNNPVTIAPQIEPVLKFELWKEAGSGAADYSGALFPGFGDRVWDTDQNAGQALHVAAGQSQASWVDINNSGTTSFGLPVAQSLVTSEWRRVETTIVIDDDPLDDGFGWSIGSETFTVADIEEIRGVMFLGDYAGTNLTGAGSVWIDNVLVEVFADEATLLATPNTNPMPVAVAGLAGDYNNDGRVDAADYTVWRDGESPDSTPAGYAAWAANYGNVTPMAVSIPEPMAATLAALGLALAATRRRVA